MFTGTNKDRRGIVRGECRDCPEGCDEYSQPISRDSCDYCGCPAGRHVRLDPRPELIIKVEPGEDDEGAAAAAPPAAPRAAHGAGPSRRTAIEMGLGGGDISTKHPKPTVRQHDKEKRCKQLFESNGETYNNLTIGDKKLGIFTILYKGEIIYVGEPKKTPIKTSLRSIFRGNCQDISKFIKRVTTKGNLERYVKIAWLGHVRDDPHEHTCKEGRKPLSYRQCISRLQGGRTPRQRLQKLLANLQ